MSDTNENNSNNHKPNSKKSKSSPTQSNSTHRKKSSPSSDEEQDSSSSSTSDPSLSDSSSSTQPPTKKSNIITRTLAHRFKQEIAFYVAPPLFKYYMPLEIQQLLDNFIYLLSTYAVGDKVAGTFKDTIIKSLVELFVMFDDGVVPTADFRDVYQKFRRVCAICRNTYFLKQTTLQREELEGNKTNEQSVKQHSSSGGSSSEGKKKEKGREDHKARKGEIREEEGKGEEEEVSKEKRITQLVDPQAIRRISELVNELNKEVIDLVIPLGLTKVTVQEIQDIFDVIKREDWIKKCFEDPGIGKVICHLADFLQNY